jgi:two-component system cell cycle response regulator
MSVPADAVDRLQARVEGLEQERKRLLAIIDLLREIGGSVHYLDIVQAVTRRLGNTFGLDRCSIFLVERGGGAVHLVSSYEDPGLRNHVVDLSRYPELRRALETGQTVNIPDATRDPSLSAVLGSLSSRRVKSITVVPLQWKGTSIGAIFLRTYRGGKELNAADLEFCQTVADLTARALRNAYQYERLLARRSGGARALQRERERAAMVEFLRRFLAAFQEKERTAGADVLGRTTSAELDRLVGVALAVVLQEAETR